MKYYIPIIIILVLVVAIVGLFKIEKPTPEKIYEEVEKIVSIGNPITRERGLIEMGDQSIVYVNKIYFNAYLNSSEGNELYSYDGVNTPVLVSDINPGVGSSSITNYTIFNSKLYNENLLDMNIH